MIGEQVFVGIVAIALGLFALTAAIHNHEWYFRITKARWIEKRWGRGAVRIIYALLGFAMIVLGIVIATRQGENEQTGMHDRTVVMKSKIDLVRPLPDEVSL